MSVTTSPHVPGHPCRRLSLALCDKRQLSSRLGKVQAWSCCGRLAGGHARRCRYRPHSQGVTQDGSPPARGPVRRRSLREHKREAKGLDSGRIRPITSGDAIVGGPRSVFEGAPSALQRSCRRLRGGGVDGVDKASAAASTSMSTWTLRNCSRVSSSWSVKPPSLRRMACART